MSRSNDSVTGRDRRVGLIFDERMCKHYSPHEEDHPECPDRIRVIWDLLNSSGLAKRCIILKAKDAEDNHLALVHTKTHISLIKSISSGTSESKRKKIAAKFDSIYFNEGSTEAACLAAGSVIEAAEKVGKGEIDSAFAIVRPPGHHAEEERDLEINKILIVDWDVHHGNGTQKMFYKDPRVLFFSVHRYDFGTFYPASHDGSYIMTGEGPGAGHNINVPWEHGRCGDADYLAVWDHILIPVAKEFNPDMIIISAGFDAAIGDPLGGCRISPYGYSIMLDKLMEFAGGKIVMALEGGYNLNSIASSARSCVEVLLHDTPLNVVSKAYPFASTWRVIKEVRRELSTYWPVLAGELPEYMICKTAQIEILSSDSVAETEEITLAVPEEVQTIEDVKQPLSNLKIDLDGQVMSWKNRTKLNLPVGTSGFGWRKQISEVFDLTQSVPGLDSSLVTVPETAEAGTLPASGRGAPMAEDVQPFRRRKRVLVDSEGRPVSKKVRSEPTAQSFWEKETASDAVREPAAEQESSEEEAFDIEISWPKPATSMTAKQCACFIHGTFNHPEDRKKMENTTDEALCNGLSLNLTRATLFFSEIQRRLLSYEASAQSAQQKDRELVLTLKKLSAAEAELKAEKAARAELEVRVGSLESELQMLQQTRQAEIDELRVKFASSLSKAEREVGVKVASAYKAGAQNCRREFFVSAMGQQFLRVMHEELLEAYRRTPFFFEDFSQALACFVEETARKTLIQVGSSEEETARLDLAALVDSIDDAAVFAKLGIDTTMSADCKWWLPVMDKAIKVFAESHSNQSGLPPDLFYDSPYILQLLQRLRERTASASSGTPTGSSATSEPRLQSTPQAAVEPTQQPDTFQAP